MEKQEQNNQAVLAALGYPVLPQSVVPVTNTKTTIQRTQYDPVKLQAVMTALQKPRSLKSRGEIIAETLAGLPEERSFKGGFGEEIINPWAMALSSFARSYGNAYKSAKEDQRAKELEDRENLLKAAQLELEASKKGITSESENTHLKINSKTGDGGLDSIPQAQKDAAISALKELNKIAEDDKISGWNNEADSRWNSRATNNILGKREQALSALLPLTNSIAKASGGSGINTLGEMMAYLGVPENATSAQIKGAIPGLIKKLGFREEDIYGKQANATPKNVMNINGYTVEILD